MDQRKTLTKKKSKQIKKSRKQQKEIGQLACPLANTIAINAAASITQDNGFHMKPKNLRNLFSCNRQEVKKLIREVQSRQSSWGVFPHNQGMWLLNWRKQKKSATLGVIVERGFKIGASANNTLQLESLYHSLLSKCICKQNTTKGEQNGHCPYHFLL